MHGCSSGSAVLVNAEVDSMGGIVDCGVGIGIKTSPQKAAIEKAQTELRQEYDVREERRRELEFLEKGGNPLDFKFGNAASISIQSTSLTDQHPEHFVTSEAKDSFALTASPHGDSVESSGRPGAPKISEPNTADNLLLFDGETKLLQGKKSPIHAGRKSNVSQSEQSSKIDGSKKNAKEPEDSAIFRPYARRNRSRSNRDVARSSSTDVIQSRSCHGSSLPIRAGPRDAKGPLHKTTNQKDLNIPPVSNPKSSSNGNIVSKIVTSEDCGLPENRLDVTESKSLTGNLMCTNSRNSDHHTHTNMASGGPDIIGGKEVISVAPDCPPGTTMKPENETGSGQLNGFSDSKIVRKTSPNEVQISNFEFGTKGLDSESSCTETSLSLDVNNGNDFCTNPRIIDSNRKPAEETSEFARTPNLAGSEMVKEKIEGEGGCSGGIMKDHISAHQNFTGNSSIVKAEKEILTSTSDLQNDVKHTSNVEGAEQKDHMVSETDGKEGNPSGDNSKPEKENILLGRSEGSSDFSVHNLSESTLIERDSSHAPDLETCSENCLKLANMAREESVLEEARIIEAKQKRIAELSVSTLPLENRQKSLWDFVLEEMAWLANDFAQERLWKTIAAAQVCHQVASTSRLRFDQQNKQGKLNKVAYTLAKAVMQFWQSAEVLLKSDGPSDLKNSKYELVGSRNIVGKEVSEHESGEPIKKTGEEFYPQNPGKALAVREYAVRFLKYNSSIVLPSQAEEPMTPENTSDMGIVDMSWEAHLTEESLFYTVPTGAMETYRKSIESHLLQCKKSGSIIEEVESCMYEDVADFGYEEVDDEGEGETRMYYYPGASEGRKSTKFAQKKRKNLKSHIARSYDVGTDLPYGNCAIRTQQSTLMGKRPSNSLNVGSIPTKRIRTASRQRVSSPFGTAAAVGLQAPTKTEASSGDTNSFQDDQSTLQGGSQPQKSMEVESFGEFEKHLPYDCAETSTKSKKKGSTYEQGWQMDSTFHNEHRDYSKRRFESHHFNSHGTSGLYVQHTVKKPKLQKQSIDNTFDNPVTGSAPSPVTSQISNMSNSNKFIKLIGRDRGRKAKVLKMSAVQHGSGSPWSTFEDQALVVLVHDMGPNWDLVSDAINSTVQFKCIFRKPKECKERHKILMARGAGDGADSAEDSGSSQSYPSTLPGIPKGSARQLFQRLQGPMEEDTLKSHFEKIIIIGHKQLYLRSQNDTQDLMQRVAVHNSHIIALSQLCPNNLNGRVLTPLDLCDTVVSSPDVLSPGCQASNANGLAITNQAAASSILPMSAANSSLQGSSGMVHGNNLSSPSRPLNASVRDSRSSVPRSPSLPVDEQQKMQQYNQMLSGRSIQLSSLSIPGTLSGPERSIRMLPGGNGMMCGMNRSVQMTRPGFQGMTSSSMMNSTSMLSTSMARMPNAVSMHTGGGPGQGNSMLRPREVSHMMRPGHNPEHQRQMMGPEHQMQATQGNSQGIPTLNGLNPAFCTQTTPPVVQTYPGHPQQPHPMSPPQSHVVSNPHLQGANHVVGLQQQAYAMRIAKDRQMQHRYLQQQQQQHQQFLSSNAVMPHVQQQPQLPMSSSQIQAQTPSQTVSLPPHTPSPPMTPMSSQNQHKHHMQPQSLSRNPQAVASVLTNQMGKQRQCQPQHQFQNSGRHHPQQQQRPHTQPQQQAKLSKGAGRGSMQNLSIDPSQLNGLSMASVSQAAEKGEQIMHLMQSQGLYSGSGTNSVQPSMPLVPPQSSTQSHLQQKLTKQLQQMPNHSDNSAQSQVPKVPSSPTFPASNQAVTPATMVSNHQQVQLQPQPQPQPQPQLYQKQVNQSQSTLQRMRPQNRQLNSDPPSKPQTNQAHTDQQSANNVSQASTSMAVSQARMDSANVVQTVFDSAMPNMSSQMGSITSPPLTNSVGSKPILPVGQGLGQRQLSGSMPPHGNDIVAQWQPQSQLQKPQTQPHLQEQKVPQQEQQKQPHQQMQPQQQAQHMQMGQGNMYISPTYSKMD